jgi:predicted esterase
MEGEIPPNLPSRPIAATLLGAAAAGAVLGLSLRSGRREVPPDPGPHAEPPPIILPPADWCAPGFEPIDGDGCLAAPPGRAPRPLIVYLHGRYAQDAASEEMDRQRRLAQRATARGFVVLSLRGRIGACKGAILSTWFCWPTSGTDEAIAAFVLGWNQALDAAKARTLSPVRYVLGFSNGGYFAGLLASRGQFEASAFLVAHGGPVLPLGTPAEKRPILLLSADDDVAQDDMIRFDEELVRQGWPHDSYARSGGHSLTDDDIDVAVTFFSFAGEGLPAVLPSSWHRAVRHVRDAGIMVAPMPQDASVLDGDDAASSSPSPYEADSLE